MDPFEKEPNLPVDVMITSATNIVVTVISIRPLCCGAYFI